METNDKKSFAIALQILVRPHAPQVVRGFSQKIKKARGGISTPCPPYARPGIRLYGAFADIIDILLFHLISSVLNLKNPPKILFWKNGVGGMS